MSTIGQHSDVTLAHQVDDLVNINTLGGVRAAGHTIADVVVRPAVTTIMPWRWVWTVGGLLAVVAALIMSAMIVATRF